MSHANQENGLKPIAIYLPQFHPFPENNEWWGKGFTEWTNVVRSGPKFPGHYQPHLPADLGFYDLRLLETMEAQADLAGTYGIHGFCYYHYWFNGKLLMERPLEQMLKSGKPDFPFCLCWANENWTRKWDGADQQVLIHQDYHPDDDRAHIEYLMPFFKDKRYIKINGKPVYLMYRSELHPNIIQATEIWREEAKKAGFEDIYLIRVENFKRNLDPKEHGFDASMEFAPDIYQAGRKYGKKNLLRYLLKKALHNLRIKRFADFENKIVSLKETAVNMLKKPKPDYTYFRCVSPCWDNSARRKSNAVIYVESEPDNFKKWVSEIKDYTLANFEDEEKIFFINAWNEWAEGCHLEPDQKYGKDYLKAFRDGLNS
ncbi:glycoside hydrolase family 99-like domain-containing protein [Pedobacter steynii]|uniref:Glycosyl hydrolase n=1 Tax=Pedobacter steynii TaxID=430522 RepID=A0A1D7QG72_9SPHI|nr:glycoside hydrolase family 99-like domain-containing protein [Pedobacter steynii]AOM77589.1 glycosyl hydrolase [Pedobacter steynii]